MTRRNGDEVGHARSRFEHDGADAVLGHEPPRFLDPRSPLILRNGNRDAGVWFQRPDCLGNSLSARPSAALRGDCRLRSRRDGGRDRRLDERSAGNAHSVFLLALSLFFLPSPVRYQVAYAQ
jgi:hypothetical protein